MTNKQRVQSVFPSAKFTRLSILSACMISADNSEGRFEFGNIYKTQNENEAWKLAWSEVQKRMLKKLKEIN